MCSSSGLCCFSFDDMHHSSQSRPVRVELLLPCGNLSYNLGPCWAGRLYSRMDDGFAVFLIGVGVNDWFKLPSALWVLMSLHALIRELKVQCCAVSAISCNLSACSVSCHSIVPVTTHNSTACQTQNATSIFDLNKVYGSLSNHAVWFLPPSYMVLP